MSKFSAFCITIRPRGGVVPGEDLETWIKTYATTMCKHHHIIAEMDNEARHLHGALFLKQPRALGNLKNRFSTWFEKLGKEDDERKVMMDGVKIMYNSYWLDTYLCKDADHTVVSTSFGQTDIRQFLSVQNWPDKPQAKKRPAVDMKYDSLKNLWYEYHREIDPVNIDSVKDFIENMMFGVKRIRVREAQRDRTNMAVCLFKYLSSSAHWVHEEDLLYTRIG